MTITNFRGKDEQLVETFNLDLDLPTHRASEYSGANINKTKTHCECSLWEVIAIELDKWGLKESE